MKKLAILFSLALLFSLKAENTQDYVLNKKESATYVQMSRAEVKKRNFTLAKLYAKRAIQADAWNKLAWENYEDIIQHLADEGLISEFGAHADESEASTPKPAGGAQFEGC